ncbi:MAG: hypothetical protein ACI4OM_00485, partial [Evtepia sp.]
VGPFLGANMIDSITCFSAAAFVLSWAITCWSLIRLRKTEPSLNRPYKIPGGLAMAGFAAIVSTVVLICMFIPASPFYVGAQAVKMFFGWLVIGLILYLASSGQRKGMSLADLKHGVFAHMEEK